MALAQENGASDLHLEPGLPAALRVRDSLRTTGDPVPAGPLLEIAQALIGPQNWPAFRGADASGLSTGRPPVQWDAKTRRNVAWTAALPGLAHSSPIVWGDVVYVTTAVASSGTPALATGDVDRAGIDPAPDMVSHTWKLIALDRASGRIVWTRDVHQGVPRVKRHVKRATRHRRRRPTAA